MKSGLNQLLASLRVSRLQSNTAFYRISLVTVTFSLQRSSYEIRFEPALGQTLLNYEYHVKRIRIFL